MGVHKSARTWFRVTRTWFVEALNVDEAISKSKNWDHNSIVVKKASPMEKYSLKSKESPSRFINHYQCPDCGVCWQDHWSCTCNDKCPVCNKEIEPLYSTDMVGG